MHDTEDKLHWCNTFAEKEPEFVQCVAPQLSIAVMMNPQKLAGNPYVPDLMVPGGLADLKSPRTPFFTAGRYGMAPRFVVTLNRKDVERYQRLYDANVLLYFWVDWERHHCDYGVQVPRLEAVCSIPTRTVVEWVCGGRLPLHPYKRRVGDTSGNALDSYVLDLRWMRLHGFKDFGVNIF